MKRILTPLALATMMFAVFAMTVPAAYAAPCSNATLIGVYGWTTSDAQFMGHTTVDGRGHYSSVFTANSNGTITQGNTETGTYSVNPDCSGSAVSSDGSNHYDMFIVSSGLEVLMIFTSPGSPQITFDLKRRDLVPTR